MREELRLNREQAGKLMDMVEAGRNADEVVATGSKVWQVDNEDSDLDYWTTPEFHDRLHEAINSFNLPNRQCLRPGGYEAQCVRFYYGRIYVDVVRAYDQYDFQAVRTVTDMLCAPGLRGIIKNKAARILLFRTLQNLLRYMLKEAK